MCHGQVSYINNYYKIQCKQQIRYNGRQMLHTVIHTQYLFLMSSYWSYIVNMIRDIKTVFQKHIYTSKARAACASILSNQDEYFQTKDLEGGVAHERNLSKSLERNVKYRSKSLVQGAC